MDEEVAPLLDALEEEHQRVKRAYLMWCAGQTSLKLNGVGAENNPTTQDWLKSSSTALDPVKPICKRIVAASKTLLAEEKSDLIREVYFVHPSFHEIWWIEKHFASNRDRILFKSPRYALDRLSGWLDNNNSRFISGTATFLARYTILFENLFSSRLTTSLIDASPDQTALRSNVRDAVNSWGTLSITEFVKEMPVLHSITRTLLDMSRSRGLEPWYLLDTNRWMVTWAQCIINEGPLIARTSELSRTEIFRSLPSITDQRAIRAYLRDHYTVSCDPYYDLVRPGWRDCPDSMEEYYDRILPQYEATTQIRKPAGPTSKTPLTPSRQPRATPSGARPDITARIELWRGSQGFLRFPDQGLTNGGRQYVAFRYGPDRKKQHDLVSIRNDATVTLELNKKLAEKPPFTTPEARMEMVSRLNSELGLSIPEGMAERKPSFPIAVLDPPEKFAAFTEILDWVMTEIRRNEPGR